MYVSGGTGIWPQRETVLIRFLFETIQRIARVLNLFVPWTLLSVWGSLWHPSENIIFRYVG